MEHFKQRGRPEDSFVVCVEDRGRIVEHVKNMCVPKSFLIGDGGGGVGISLRTSCSGVRRENEMI